MLRYSLQVYLVFPDKSQLSVLTFDTDFLDHIYQIIGNNPSWVSNAEFFYTVLDHQALCATDNPIISK